MQCSDATSTQMPLQGLTFVDKANVLLMRCTDALCWTGGLLVLVASFPVQPVKDDLGWRTAGHTQIDGMMGSPEVTTFHTLLHGSVNAAASDHRCFCKKN